MSSLHFLCLLSIFLLLFLSSSESRPVVRFSGDSAASVGEAAVDLNRTSFESFLKSSPASFAIVEFFAHWCPACRNYKPHYEKVARLFNGPDAAHPGIIVMTRVDCANKMNRDLCDRFSVAYYPMLLWGSPITFAAGRWDPTQQNNDIQSIDDGRTAERLLNWINKQIGSSFNLDDEKYENEHSLARNASDPQQIARAIYDVEEATANAFDIIVEHKMIKSDTRASLMKFFQLLVVHHPSERSPVRLYASKLCCSDSGHIPMPISICNASDTGILKKIESLSNIASKPYYMCRRGTAELLVNFYDLWHSDISSVSLNDGGTLQDREALEAFKICGKEVPRGYWIFCRGSKNDTRGYSCGLWVLLHSLSVRVGDGESHLAFTTIRDFIHNFFICEECSRHFGEMCSSVSDPFNSTRALALWLWKAHNKVNERLMKEEKALGTGDPRFPKIVWPPKQLCPSCYLAEFDWNYDGVFMFLRSYYGKNLVSAYKDKNLVKLRKIEWAADDTIALTSALAVPFGAALAIAVASCAFGALACFWRTQQKSRKYLRSLKNI